MTAMMTYTLGSMVQYQAQGRELPHFSQVTQLHNLLVFRHVYSVRWQWHMVEVYGAHNKQFGSSPNKHSDKSLPVPQRQEQGTHLSERKLEANMQLSLLSFTKFCLL